MFLNTLSITSPWVDSAYSHLLGGTSTTVSPDKRGVHGNRPKKTSDAQKQTARDHINQYPKMPSHYCRSRTSREYLECGLNVSKMYRHYGEWFSSSGLPEKSKASKRAYEEIFNTEFNLGFFIPKKDQCSLCNLVKFGTRQEREKFKTKYASHILNKKLAQNKKSAAKGLAVANSNTTAACVFDFQKILQCPKSETSTFFYKNKLSAYNFTVYDMVNHQGLCYMWHEATAKKGADEVSSMLLHYFEQLAKKGIKKIKSFSDSCWSQNKNRFVYAMLLIAAARYDIEIEHCFLEPGHTHNEGDSVHATIEAATKNRHIFDFSEWTAAVRTAKVNEPKYEVLEVTQEMVYDFHKVVSLQNWKCDTEKRQIKWSNVRLVRASHEHIGILKFQYDFQGPTFSLDTKQRKGHPLNLKTFKLAQRYNGKISLKNLKIKHIQELCRSLAIPSKYHNFYDEIIKAVEPVDNDDDEDPDAEEDCAEECDEELGRYVECRRQRKKNCEQEEENEVQIADEGEGETDDKAEEENVGESSEETEDEFDL
jgi:hypothetical protein